MLCFATLLILVAVVGETQSHPVPCNEDFHCPDNWFCKTPAHACHNCVDCRKLNRIPPLPQWLKIDTCLKSKYSCGPCLEGWALDRLSQNCEPVEEKTVHFISTHVLWFLGVGAAAGLLLSVLFLDVLRSTNVYRIVNV